MPSPGHSAHVGQEVVIHYRWHALYGRRLRRQYSETRQSGAVVHVEVAPGVVIVVAAWMLDPVACAGQELGPPHVSLAALRELHELLTAGLSASSSRDDSSIVREKHHDEPADRAIALQAATPAEHASGFGEASRHGPEPARPRRRASRQPADGGSGDRDKGARR
jgi:hypothetical protein